MYEKPYATKKMALYAARALGLGPKHVVKNSNFVWVVRYPEK